MNSRCSIDISWMPACVNIGPHCLWTRTNLRVIASALSVLNGSSFELAMTVTSTGMSVTVDLIGLAHVVIQSFLHSPVHRMGRWRQCKCKCVYRCSLNNTAPLAFVDFGGVGVFQSMLAKKEVKIERVKTRPETGQLWKKKNMFVRPNMLGCRKYVMKLPKNVSQSQTQWNETGLYVYKYVCLPTQSVTAYLIWSSSRFERLFKKNTEERSNKKTTLVKGCTDISPPPHHSPLSTADHIYPHQQRRHKSRCKQAIHPLSRETMC